MAKITFEIDDEILDEFNEVNKKLDEKYSDPFDQDAWLENRMKEFNEIQKLNMSLSNYAKS